MRSVIVSLLLLLGLPAHRCQAQSSFSVSGIVTDGYGRPIAGATVLLQSMKNTDSVISDANGCFYTHLLLANGYNWVVVAGHRRYKLGRLYLHKNVAFPAKQYVIKISDQRASWHITDNVL